MGNTKYKPAIYKFGKAAKDPKGAPLKEKVYDPKTDYAGTGRQPGQLEKQKPMYKIIKRK